MQVNTYKVNHMIEVADKGLITACTYEAGVPNKLSPQCVNTHTLPVLGRDVPRSTAVCEVMWYCKASKGSSQGPGAGEDTDQPCKPQHSPLSVLINKMLLQTLGLRKRVHNTDSRPFLTIRLQDHTYTSSKSNILLPLFSYDISGHKVSFSWYLISFKMPSIKFCSFYFHFYACSFCCIGWSFKNLVNTHLRLCW